MVDKALRELIQHGWFRLQALIWILHILPPLL